MAPACALRNTSFAAVALLAFGAIGEVRVAQAASPSRAKVLATMKRATQFMVDKVSTHGGYVWAYLPDMSRRWGEMEARDTMIWLQAPGTSSMGHLFLDAYHVTGDEYYYAAAEQVGAAIIWGQLPSGGWNYVVDFAGDRSLREWYDTIGRNGWRLEEFQHYYGNGTFDDQVTSEAAKFLLRLYVEKHDPKYRPALDKAIQFVLDSQYPVGAWPQRYPLKYEFSHSGLPDYTSYLTLNDDVTEENVEFLIFCYRVLGEQRLLDPIIRGMNSFLVLQNGPPQPGWALQYTLDLKPAGARTYEPKALVTHTSARAVAQLIKFYRLTGETKFLARVPEALDWLESVRLPADWHIEHYTHPTYIELGTNKPLFVHRTGSNVVNGRYYVDYDHRNTLAHYSAFRLIDVAGLRKQYEEARALAPEALIKDSPLFAGAGVLELPRRLTVLNPELNPTPVSEQKSAEQVLRDLTPAGNWLSPLRHTSNPYRGAGPAQAAPGDFAATYVGDDFDTSPYPSKIPVNGIATVTYIENMNVLLSALEPQAAPPRQ